MKQATNEWGWADYRVTDDAEIERWWELVFSAYQLVSFHCPAFGLARQEVPSEQDAQTSPVEHFAEHAWRDMGQGWKNTLNNLRLILQPHVFSCLLLPWLVVFDLPGLRAGFLELTTLMNFFHASPDLTEEGQVARQHCGEEPSSLARSRSDQHVHLAIDRKMSKNRSSNKTLRNYCNLI